MSSRLRWTGWTTGRLVLRARASMAERPACVAISQRLWRARGGVWKLSWGRSACAWRASWSSFSGGSLHQDADSASGQVCEFRLTLPTDRQITVLAIDDNPDTLAAAPALHSQFTRYGLQCENDPARSLALAEETMPDIILLDVLLQDIDGWELLGRFRAHPRLGDKPVIVCTILPQRDLGAKPGRRRFLEQAPQPAAVCSPPSMRRLTAPGDKALRKRRSTAISSWAIANAATADDSKRLAHGRLA